jgi:hemimethylated DNA binding protein
MEPIRRKDGKLEPMGKTQLANDLGSKGPGGFSAVLDARARAPSFATRTMIREAFRAALTDEKETVLANAFEGIRSLNELTKQLQGMEKERKRRAKVGVDVDFPIGGVCRHKKWNYRGVIVGWDEICKRPEQWLLQNDISLSRGLQPFYYFIPDDEDCIREFGALRHSKYVAQDNLELLTASSDCEISHDSLWCPLGFEPASPELIANLQYVCEPGF